MSFSTIFYSTDLIIGFGSVAVLYFLLKKEIIKKNIWNIFWLGSAIGFIWELPIFVFSAENIVLPLIIWTHPLPWHYSIFLAAHTLWDGLLFVIGVWLIKKINPGTCLDRFRFKELIILIGWGEVSALDVELSSTLNNAWSYYEHSWNPVLFTVNHQNITLLPQIIWAVAPIVFYLIVIRYRFFQSIQKNTVTV